MSTVVLAEQTHSKLYIAVVKGKAGEKAFHIYRQECMHNETIPRE